MDINQLEIFLQVIQYGSFGKTAKNNFLSQRAVSKQITRLENELNTNLFNRGKNKITLTQQGKMFLPSAQDIVNNVTEAVADLKNYDKETHKFIRAGYFSPFEGKLLQNALYHLSKEEHLLNITVHEQSNEHLLQSISNGSLDIGLSINYGKPLNIKENDFQIEKMYSNQMVMGISKQNIQSGKKHLSLNMLPKLPILYFSLENSTFLLESFRSSLSSMQEIKNIRRSTSIEQMHMLVALNKAIAFYPAGLISQQEMQNDKYVSYIPFDKAEDQKYQIIALYKSQNNNEMLRRLLAILRNFSN